jgi:inactive phospholipase C-like protein 2
MSSFWESRALKYSKERTLDFIDYNKRQLARIYPAARRALSSNFYPIPYWRAGCQIGKKSALPIN